MDNYEVRIKANEKFTRFNFAELWRYRDLIVFFVQRNYRLIYKQTILGPLWILINPLITSIVFTIVFGNVADISTDGIPQLLFYMAGNTIWGLFSRATVGISDTFTKNAQIFGKVYFPRLTIPLSQAISSLVDFFIQLMLLLLILGYYLFTGFSLSLNLSLLFLPVLLIQCIVLSIGVGLVFSSLTTKYKDLARATVLLMQVWMYVTPIIYPLSLTEGFSNYIVLLNPMAPIVNNFRYILLGSGEFLMMPWLVSLAVTALLLWVGVEAFNKVEKTFVDII